MVEKAHYITVAGFLLRGAGEDTLSVHCSIGEDVDGKALVRKICICGSHLEYDHEYDAWVCSQSGEELEIPGTNLNALRTDEDVEISRMDFEDDLRHPEQNAKPLIDAEGRPHLVIKVPRERAWIISDPLPIFEFFLFKPIEADLLVRWDLEIGNGLPGELWVEVDFNISDQLHGRYLALLESGAAPHLHFLSADSLTLLGHKRIKAAVDLASTMKEARSLAARLPLDVGERIQALDDFLVAQKLARDACLDKMGMLWCTEFERLLRADRPVDLRQHVQACSVCSQVFRRWGIEW